MRPTLAAEQVRRTMTQYLTTTFALADPEVREGLERFFNHPDHGVFRGPYLRIRTRYRPAADGWRDHLEWAPGGGFVPHGHQARAFERLSSLHRPPLPTLITTGTGSGKTESFLYPVLDHCRRERARGVAGVKALLLYPMNALATDQTLRLDGLLRREEALRDVTAGLYIGDTPESGYERVMTSRASIRADPPDILVTNYKMLDLLLQRGDDVPLWRDARLTYVVLDEFHTYDGAQGTDVAMLLRRLAAVAGPGGADTPLRGICPVATSATLGAGGDAGRIRDAARNAFGVAFDADSVLGEDRLSVEEFIPHANLDYTLPLPEPRELAALPDPQGDPGALAEIARVVTGDALTGDALGAALRGHILTAAVLEVLGEQPRTTGELLDRLPRHGAYNWGAAIRDNPGQAATALARFVALLSVATDPQHPGEPLLQIETHLWGRAVTRLLREVSARPAFAWYGEDPPLPEDTTHLAAVRDFLPAVYCRHCGRSGWAALSPEKDPHLLIAKPDRIYRAAPAGTKQHVRALIAATPAEAADYAADPARPEVHVLDATGGRVRPYDPVRDADEVQDGVLVLANLHHDREGNTAARRDRCPACGDDEGIRFIGTGVAALASVAVTELFTGGELTGSDRKTLLFNDSVQDAAHRAGYVANRSYGFSLRALLADGLREHGDTAVPLNDLIADVVERISDRHLAAVVPPDLHDRPEIDALLAGEHPGTQATWNLLAERLAFATVLEFGLRSRQGRTLELTRTVAAEVALRDPLRIADVARSLHRTGGYGLADEPELTAYVTYIRGLLERMRRRGGVDHHWLRAWVGRAGTSRFGTIWGERPDGMPAFGGDAPAPRFVLTADKPRTEFDRLDRQQSWYADWTARCIGIPAAEAPRYLRALLPALMGEGVIASRRADDGSTTVYGLKPGHIEVRPLSDAQVNEAGVGCDTCPWTQTVHPDRIGDWLGHRCPRYRCGGRLVRRTADFATDYYRRLYTTAEPYTVRTAEHTGTLTRAQRERVERAFLDGSRYSDPNVLSCTPTLELGIDIGDLSSVVLASLPRGPANYVQRAGRAGRRSGNALVFALAGRRARDRYFLADPRDMIAGEIVPPGCYLSAVEILRRQYIAHLIDLAARGGLPGVPPLPRLASVLFGPQRWLDGLAAAALDRGDALAEGFLALFGTRTGDDGARVDADGSVVVAADAAEGLREFARSGLADVVATAEATWRERLAGLRERLDAIAAAKSDLVESDPEQAALGRQLDSEKRAVAWRVGAIERVPAQQAMIDLGLLPNYSLIDTVTTLEATLTWREDTEDGEHRYRSELREYPRSARFALTELAPGNSYYVQGFKHEITGLDLGTRDRPAWRQWRICSECGFVRTGTDTADTSPCPRCANQRIGDVSALHDVLVPTRVTARDRRDDARIRDDSDERDRVSYKLVPAFDIAPEDIEDGSWRLTGRTFGVDYSRRAMIRLLNVGPVHPERPDNDLLAGVETQISPFTVCETCGGVLIDGRRYPPGGPGHHRPWCPRRNTAGDREGHRQVVLAHELRTEALRILLPVADTAIVERAASFAAALMAGVADHYGGDPDHLALRMATMPDQNTGLRRRFVVLYDALPGGTGYLHRLADQEEFRTVLRAARRVITECRCVGDGKKACHRCLLGRLDNDDGYELIDRRVAVEILDELLDNWTAEPVSHTGEVSLWDQVESELERRFLRLLDDWAKDNDGASLSRVTEADGVRRADLRVTGPDGQVVHWEVRLQNTIRQTRPDVLLQRVDADPLTVAVYLDGYRWHAALDVHERLAEDAAVREKLRADGTVVFQLVWDDIKAWPGDGDAPIWPPYSGDAQLAARQFYQRSVGGDPARLRTRVWTNPVITLLAFLADPDRDAWRRDVQGALAGLLRHPEDKTGCASGGTLPAIFTAALHEAPLPPGEGPLAVVRAKDGNGCPVTLVVDRRTGTPAWTAAVTLDDDAETIKADREGHERRWAGWLYWGNLVQFLDGGGGDGHQLTLGMLDAFDATGLAAARPEVPGAETTAPPVPAGPSPEWRAVLDLIDPDDRDLHALMRRLAERGLPVPEVGYELGDGNWQAEVAWPERHVGVVLADGGSEAERRDAAYTEAHWDVRPAGDWSPDELERRIEGEGQ